MLRPYNRLFWKSSITYFKDSGYMVRDSLGGRNMFRPMCTNLSRKEIKITPKLKS